MSNVKKTNNLVIGNEVLDLVDDEARDLIAGVNGDISTMEARIDNLITTYEANGGTKRTETVLFSSDTPSQGNVPADSGYFDLEDSIDEYDYIEVYYSAFNKHNLIRIKPDDVPVAGETGANPVVWSAESIPDVSSANHALVRTATFVLYKFDDEDRVSIEFWMRGWNGSHESDSDFGDPTAGTWKIGILKIVGIKYESAGSIKDAELADIRTGVDGTVYSSAGAAVRGQIDGLNEDLSHADLFEDEIYAVSWEHGTINLTDGLDSVSNTRIRCDIHEVGHKTVSVENGAKFAFRFYTSSGVWVPASGDATYTWYTTEKDVAEIASGFTNAEKFRLVLAYSNDASTATSQEMQDLIDMVTVEQEIPKIGRIDDEVETALEITDTLNWKLGSIGVNNGQDGVSTTRARTFGFIPYNSDAIISLTTGAKYNIFAYDKDKAFLWAPGVWQTSSDVIKNIITRGGKSDASVKYIRFSIAYSNDATITDVPTLGNYFELTEKGNMQAAFTELGRAVDQSVNASGLGNFSIRCAKEQSYTDGTSPVIEWFLLEEPNSGRFYYSKDLKNKSYLFTFPYDTYRYSFGILQNGDIIACLDADSIATENKSDVNRENPYVFLASENWSICHEVDFGADLKPCGWLSNCGFKVLADGSAIFCEYTRQTTYTANVWKLSGDPTDKSNWVVTKSFVVTSTDNSTLFKHCHMVMQDFYTGICYMATGDDNIGAMLYYSSDNGSTWTQLVSPDSDGQINEYGYINGSEKYCRMLTMTFTEDYIYWASDTPTAGYHYLFRAERNSSGVLDYSTVSDYVNLPANNGASTYGTAYIPELNAILLLDRCDRYADEMEVKMALLNNGSLVTIGKLYPTAEESATGSNLGFRTRFSEWYPNNGLVHVGFGVRGNHYNNDINHNKGFGNTGTWIIGGGINNINNLSVQVFHDGNTYGMKLNTCY